MGILSSPIYNTYKSLNFPVLSHPRRHCRYETFPPPNNDVGFDQPTHSNPCVEVFLILQPATIGCTIFSSESNGYPNRKIRKPAEKLREYEPPSFNNKKALLRRTEINRENLDEPLGWCDLNCFLPT